MANGKSKIQKDIPIPSFIDQANALINDTYKQAKSIDDSRYRPGLNIQDHKLWVSVMDLHVKHVSDVQASIFTEAIAEHYGPIMKLLSNLQIQQETIVGDIKSLKDDLTELSRTYHADVQKINSKLANDEREIRLMKETICHNKIRVDDIENNLRILQPDIINKFIERIKEITPALESIQIDQKRILKTQIIRSVAKRIGIAVLISLILTWFAITVSFYIHNNKTTELLEKLIPQTEQPLK